MPTESPSRAQIAEWESKYLQEVDLSKIKKPVRSPLPELDALPKPIQGRLQAQPTPSPYSPAQIAEMEAEYLKDWQTRNANATKYKPQPLPELSTPIPAPPENYTPAQQAAWESEYLKGRPATAKPKSQPIPLPELTNPIPAPPENYTPAQKAAWESEYLKSKNLTSPAQYKPQPLPELSNPIPKAPEGYSPAQQAAWESEYLKGQPSKPKPIYEPKPLPELTNPTPPPNTPVPKDFTGWEKSQMQSDYLDDWERRQKPKPSSPPPKPVETFPEPQLQPAKPKPNEPLPFDEPPPKPKPFEAQPQKPSSPVAPNAGATSAGALTAGQVARGGALITGLGIAQAASTGFGLGAGIAELINTIDPGGKEFLDDYFGREVDKPKPANEVEAPPAPTPGTPYEPISSETIRETSVSGNAANGYVRIIFPTGRIAPNFRTDTTNTDQAEFWYFVGVGRDYTMQIKEVTNQLLNVRTSTDPTTGDVFTFLEWRWNVYTNIRFKGRSYVGDYDTEWAFPVYDFYKGVNPPYWDGFRWTTTPARQHPTYSTSVDIVLKNGQPYLPGNLTPDQYFPAPTPAEYRVEDKDPWGETWQRTDTWNPPKQEDDNMACDLSPVINQLNSQSKQITTLQTTVNNLNVNNTSTVNNINANTTSAINTAVQTINTQTTTTVNGAVVAVNNATATTVTTATNTINATTTSAVNTATNTITSSVSNLSSKLTSVADDILLNMKNGFSALEAALKPGLDKIDDVVSKLSEAFAKFTERFDKFLKWIHFDRVLNLLILITTIHNAAMLSNQLASSLTSMINSLLTAGGNALGLRGVDDEPVDIGPVISGAFQGFVDGFIGKENNEEIKKQWNKYNRIYQSAANLLGSIQNLNQSILSAMEIVGGNVARIGNALRKWGEVSEDAFNWMNPQPFFSNPFSRFVEKTQQGVENTDQVAQEVISGQEQVSQIQKEIDDFKELLNKEEKTGIPAPTPAKTTATETAAKVNSTTGATPLLPSEK